jgi:hypothetical protein
MLRKITVHLAALSMMMVMSVPVMAAPDGENSGNKGWDGADKNLGGGQEKPKNEHPPHAGGDQHGGGSV